MQSRKIWTIISHEYLTRVKSKGFLIASLLAPLGMLLITVLPSLIAHVTSETTEKKLAIVDYTHDLGQKIIEKDTSKYFITDQKEEALKEALLKGDSDGFLVIPKDIIEEGNATVYTAGGGGIGYINALEKYLSQVVRRERLIKNNADMSMIELVESGIDLKQQKVTDEGVEEDYTEFYAIIGLFLGLIMYFLMFIYGMNVLRGVMDEKSNRIVEILASSAKPIEIMMGKVVGIGLVGLTQVLIWIGLSSLILAMGGSIVSFFSGQPDVIAGTSAAASMPGGFKIPPISPWLGLAFIYYFLAGYFIYATLYAAVGSAVDQEQDAQTLQVPITIPIIIPILLSSAIMANPDSPMAIGLSLFPLFTPILMTIRVAATNVPLWQIAASVVLTMLTFFGMLWVSAKIYRVGILMYGKKPTFKEIYKWIKY